MVNITVSVLVLVFIIGNINAGQIFFFFLAILLQFTSDDETILRSRRRTGLSDIPAQAFHFIIWMTQIIVPAFKRLPWEICEVLIWWKDIKQVTSQQVGVRESVLVRSVLKLSVSDLLASGCQVVPCVRHWSRHVAPPRSQPPPWLAGLFAEASKKTRTHSVWKKKLCRKNQWQASCLWCHYDDGKQEQCSSCS